MDTTDALRQQLHRARQTLRVAREHQEQGQMSEEQVARARGAVHAAMAQLQGARFDWRMHKVTNSRHAEDIFADGRNSNAMKLVTKRLRELLGDEALMRIRERKMNGERVVSVELDAQLLINLLEENLESDLDQAAAG